MNHRHACVLSAALALAALALFASCSDRIVGGAKPAGAVCADTSECDPAFTCIDMAATYVTSDDAGCSGATAHGILVCTVACESDADCAAVGSGLVCAPNGCTTRGYCLSRSDAGVMAGRH